MRNSLLLAIFALLFAGISCSGPITGFGLPDLPDPVVQVERPTPVASPVVIRPTQPDVPVEDYSETLRMLESAIVPVNDAVELAERLQGKENIPRSYDPPASPYQVGDSQSFWVTNTDTAKNFTIDTTLRYVTDHLYFWVQDGVDYDADELRKLAETFETEIYPTNREFFGSEWSPGIDGDPHLYVVYARGLGSSLAGYFSSVDEYSPMAHEYSNAHEMFLLSADNVDLGSDFAYSVLAHEFQHMIHWHTDRNEETWMNEGFADLASFLNGYPNNGSESLYAANPDIQLTDWPEDPGSRLPHYGASFLFMTYFLDRFGPDVTKAVVAHPANGMVSIDEVLLDGGYTDPVRDEPIAADDVFADWVVASYLQDERVADGRFTYHNYSNAPQPAETETISACPVSGETREVRQYGVDYIRLTCSGDYTLQFEGSLQVGVLPADPHSGDYAFWSNKGDESNMTLTRAFDFTGESGPLTLTYWTWYSLEKDYDYLYLTVSEDGEHWEILITPSGTSQNPSGNSYGWAYNGTSGNGPGAGWIQEELDLSRFAGKKVQLRFEYVTDAAVNGDGFLLDDVSIPEVGYSTDFESDDGGWEGEGFVRIQNLLPQTLRLSVISKGRTTTVDQYALSGENALEIPLQIGDDVREVILVVSGTTRFTRQPAAYRFHITP